MNPAEIEGADEARKVLLANRTPRQAAMDGLESWALGTQYDGRSSWWDDSVPLWERAPCLNYPIAAIAPASNVDMVLGEGRFPTLTAGPEDEAAEKDGLGAEASQAFDRFLREYHQQSRFKAYIREGFDAAQKVGTAVGIHGVRNDKPFCDLVKAQWCTPTFGPAGEVLQLEIRYPYLDTYKKPDGKWAVRCMLYRRVIDATSDTVFLPAVAKEEGREPSWQKDPARTVQHGLGFTPVVWYAFNKGCQAVNRIDGKAIHAHLTDEIFAHDLALSQKHRGALLSEPQIVEVGVATGFNPTEAGQTPGVPSTLDGGEVTTTNVIVGTFQEPPRKPARKKGPGYVWQYPSPDSDVKLLAYPGDALQAQENNARDIRIKLQESLAVVFLDPENLKLANTVSGKALLTLKQRQIDRCDQYRDDIADGFITPSIEMQLRIALKVKPKKVRTLPNALASIAKEPVVRVVWGPYARPDPTEQQVIVQLCMAALGQGGDDPIITREIALSKLADIFNIENVKAVLEQLEAEKLERQEQAHQQAQQEAELNGDPNADEDGSGASPQKPPQAA